MPNRLIDGRDRPIDRIGLYKPITGILITALVAFIFYQLGERPWIDPLSTLIIFLSFFQATLVVLAFTADWRWRIVGVLVALGGTSLAYGFLFAVSIEWAEVNTLFVRSTLRSSLAVGGTILAVGTWGYLYNRWRGTHEDSEFLEPRTHYRD